MTSYLEGLVVLAPPNETLQSVIVRMGQHIGRITGIALIVDRNMLLHGVLTNGDVVRLLSAGIPLDSPVNRILAGQPITASFGASDEEIVHTVRAQIFRRTGGKKDVTRHVPLVDEQGIVRDVADIFTLLARSPRQGDHVEVYGLGFVGLTLSVALAARGHNVTGIDTNKRLVRELLEGVPHVLEPRLPEMMVQALDDRRLTFSTVPPAEHHRVVIIAVGTPVQVDGSATLSALRAVCTVVGNRLHRGDLVMLRSTVPVGTTGSLVRELLEVASGLTAGDDFHLAFTPERTAEGQAMQELSSLPQIVGGFSPRCADLAGSFWQTLTDSVVQVKNLEAAELVKLINNSFRDLSFAFANALALYADHFNLDAARLISAANEGYPRNLISRPSPGVGGYCLTKDPFLYAGVSPLSGHGRLSCLGREINEQASQYPVTVLHRFSERIGKPLPQLTVLLVGMAFKGWPETNDLRGSISVSVARVLIKLRCNVLAFDAVVHSSAIEALGIRTVSLLDAAASCDALLLLNNHPENAPNGLLTRLDGRQTLLFDGWGLLNHYEVEQYHGITYATMGYMTPHTSQE